MQLDAAFHWHSPAKCDKSLTRRAESGCNGFGSMIVEAAARVAGNSNLKDSRDACDSDAIQTCVSVLLPKINVHSPRSTVGPDPDTNAGTIAHAAQSSYSSLSDLHQLPSDMSQSQLALDDSTAAATP